MLSTLKAVVYTVPCSVLLLLFFFGGGKILADPPSMPTHSFIGEKGKLQKNTANLLYGQDNVPNDQKPCP